MLSIGTPRASAMPGGGNDECSSAIAIGVTPTCAGSLSVYDATDATQSAGPIVCNGFASANALDTWFSFVATSAATEIGVEGTASYDPVLEAFGGTCGALVSLACADLTFPVGTPLQNSRERIELVTEVGQTYFVRVYAYTEPLPTEYTFSLCIHEAAAPALNDNCSGVLPQDLLVGSPLTFTGDNTNAYDGEGLGRPSVWHAFTTTECAAITLDYCGTSPAFLTASQALYIGCPWTQRVPAVSTDQSTCTDGNFTVRYAFVPAGTYYVPVLKDTLTANLALGAYTLNVVAESIAPGYCTTSVVECDEYIAQVSFGTINNTSTCAAGDAVDYTALSAEIEQGESLPITVLNGPVFYAEDSVIVWVDWDQDQTFCQTNEAFKLVSTDEGVSFAGSITAPADALTGSPTRMRVRMGYNETPRACGPAFFGETEDYTVNVLFSTGIAGTQRTAWSVYPNPSNGNMTIQYNAQEARVAIELLDVAGRVVHQAQHQVQNGQRVDLVLAGALAQGVYTLRSISPSGRWEQRIVVQ